MSRTRWFAATSTAFLLISYLVGGCAEGGDEPSGGGSGGKQNPTCSCQPGTTATCDCPGGGKGVQTCEIDCVSYTTCDCSDAGATGGSGGTGGGSTGEMGGSGGQNTGGSPTGGAGGEAASGGSAGSAGAAAGSAGSAGATGDVDVCPGEPLHLSGSGSSIRQGSATGDTSTLTHDYLGNCGSALSKDAVYVVTPDVDGVLRADLGGSEATSFDSILYARTDCTDQDSEIVCDDTYVKGSEKLEFDVLKNTPYYLFVDGYNKEAGPYELNVQVIPKGCGNGIKEPGEDCDDGNQIDDDWCHNDCTINPNPAGDTCPGMTMALTGTGTQDRVGTIAGDTSSFSSSYSSSKCVSSSTASAKDFVALVKPDVDGTMTCDLGGSTATPWDSVLYVRSQCDNVSSELACNDSASTGAEKVTLPVVKNTPYYVFVDGYGAAKSGPFVLTCTIKVAYCGNGTVEGTEECDDGNNTSGDGCSSSCKIEPKGPADICPGKTLQLKESNGTYIAFETGSTTGQTHAYVGTCGGTSTAPDQVYKFNSGVGGRVTVSIPTEGTTFDTVLYVRKDACSGPNATQVECKDTTGKGGESITFTAPPNTDYWVFVDGYSGANGNFSLEIKVVPTCGDGTLDVGEECDDGNKTSGDGCSASCKIESTCGSLSEDEPNNTYTSPRLISAACGTFRIHNAAISPAGDSDYFRINGLVEKTKVDAYAYVTTFGSCTSGAPLVISLWKNPIATPAADYGLCSGQTGNVACSASSTDGNCAKFSYTIPKDGDGDYLLKVHGSSSSSSVSSYGLLVIVH